MPPRVQDQRAAVRNRQPQPGAVQPPAPIQAPDLGGAISGAIQPPAPIPPAPIAPPAIAPAPSPTDRNTRAAALPPAFEKPLGGAPINPVAPLGGAGGVMPPPAIMGAPGGGGLNIGPALLGGTRSLFPGNVGPFKPPPAPKQNPGGVKPYTGRPSTSWNRGWQF